MTADGPIFHKFNVTRTDGSSEPGGKHRDCDYFVLDTTHDRYAKYALAAYAAACEETHPNLAADIRQTYTGFPSYSPPETAVAEVIHSETEVSRMVMLPEAMALGIGTHKLYAHQATTASGLVGAKWPNGCDQTVPAALRYLAAHPRPVGGEESFNAEHLYQLAREIEAASLQSVWPGQQGEKDMGVVTVSKPNASLTTVAERLPWHSLPAGAYRITATPATQPPAGKEGEEK